MTAPRRLFVLGHVRDDGFGRAFGDDVIERLERRREEVRVQRLLDDGFDPVLRLPPGVDRARRGDSSPLARRYQDDVLWADVITLFHPVWWFAPPALVKGWVDQVLVEGVALDDADPPRPQLGGRSLQVVQTQKSGEDVSRGVMDDMARRFWTEIVGPGVGFETVDVHVIGRVHEMDAERRERVLERIVGRL